MKIIFSKESVQEAREVREGLRADLKVSCSKASLEEISQESKEEVQEWELVEERVVEGFGLERKFSTTKVFKLVGKEQDREVEEWEDMLKEDAQGEKEGDALTEKAIEQFVRETGWKPRSAVPSSIYSVEVVYDGELWLTVA
jgi:hypothetical protein